MLLWATGAGTTASATIEGVLFLSLLTAGFCEAKVR
jgi:hypothetical protein